jgi:hypothetical protein
MKIKRFEYYIKPCYNYIGEGIDIDYLNKRVTINLNNENGIDTSIDNNPLYTRVNGYDVISIFTRKKYQRSDGNPLLYALKGINNWKIDKFDIEVLLKQFIRISERINPVYDTIIKIPSSNELNNIFMDRLNKIIKCENKISTFLSKLDPNIVWMDGIDFEKMSKEEIELLEKDFMKMDDDVFSFKFISTNLRKYIKKIYNKNYIHEQLDVADKINNKNILILDDTISTGSTISLFTKEILDMYTPNNVTIITLFSKIQ